MTRRLARFRELALPWAGLRGGARHPWVERNGHGRSAPARRCESRRRWPAGGAEDTQGGRPADRGRERPGRIAGAGPAARRGPDRTRRASPCWSFSSSSCWWAWSPRSRSRTWSGSRGPSPPVPSATTSWISSRVSAARRCCSGRAYVVFGSGGAPEAGVSRDRGGSRRTPRSRRPASAPGRPGTDSARGATSATPSTCRTAGNPARRAPRGRVRQRALPRRRALPVPPGRGGCAGRPRAAVLPGRPRCVGPGSPTPGSAGVPDGSPPGGLDSAPRRTQSAAGDARLSKLVAADHPRSRGRGRLRKTGVGLAAMAISAGGALRVHPASTRPVIPVTARGSARCNRSRAAALARTPRRLAARCRLVRQAIERHRRPSSIRARINELACTIELDPTGGSPWTA